MGAINTSGVLGSAAGYGLGVPGLGTATGLIGGKSGGGGPKPGYSNGQYTLNGTPYDTSKFNLTGNSGTYDLMPVINGGGNPFLNALSTPFGQHQDAAKVMYDKTRGALGNDRAALAQFDARFPLTQNYQPAWVSKAAPDIQKQYASFNRSPVNPYAKALGMNPAAYNLTQGMAGNVTASDIFGRPTGILGTYARNINNPILSTGIATLNRG